MKSKVTEGKDDVVLHEIKGMTNRILNDVWQLYESRPRFPLSLSVAGYIVYLEKRDDLLHFYLGLQVGIEMHMI